MAAILTGNCSFDKGRLKRSFRGLAKYMQSHCRCTVTAGLSSTSCQNHGGKKLKLNPSKKCSMLMNMKCCEFLQMNYEMKCVPNDENSRQV